MARSIQRVTKKLNAKNLYRKTEYAEHLVNNEQNNNKKNLSRGFLWCWKENVYHIAYTMSIMWKFVLFVTFHQIFFLLIFLSLIWRCEQSLVSCVCLVFTCSCYIKIARTNKVFFCIEVFGANSEMKLQMKHTIDHYVEHILLKLSSPYRFDLFLFDTVVKNMDKFNKALSLALKPHIDKDHTQKIYILEKKQHSHDCESIHQLTKSFSLCSVQLKLWVSFFCVAQFHTETRIWTNNI